MDEVADVEMSSDEVTLESMSTEDPADVKEISKKIVEKWRERYQKGSLTPVHFEEVWKVWVTRIYRLSPNESCLTWNFNEDLAQEILLNTLDEFICNGDPEIVMKRLSEMDKAPSKGFTLKVNYVKACIDNSIVQPKNIDVILDKDCNLIYTGCNNFTKTVKTVETAYEVKKPPLPNLTGNLDLCRMMESGGSKQLADAISVIGMPNKCPVQAGPKCGKGQKLNLGPYKNQLGMVVGTTIVKLDIDHDVGKSCVEFSFNINKARKG